MLLQLTKMDSNTQLRNEAEIGAMGAGERFTTKLKTLKEFLDVSAPQKEKDPFDLEAGLRRQYRLANTNRVRFCLTLPSVSMLYILKSPPPPFLLRSAWFICRFVVMCCTLCCVLVSTTSVPLHHPRLSFYCPSQTSNQRLDIVVGFSVVPTSQRQVLEFHPIKVLPCTCIGCSESTSSSSLHCHVFYFSVL